MTDQERQDYHDKANKIAEDYWPHIKARETQAENIKPSPKPNFPGEKPSLSQAEKELKKDLEAEAQAFRDQAKERIEKEVIDKLPSYATAQDKQLIRDQAYDILGIPPDQREQIRTQEPSQQRPPFSRFLPPQDNLQPRPDDRGQAPPNRPGVERSIFAQGYRTSPLAVKREERIDENLTQENPEHQSLEQEEVQDSPTAPETLQQDNIQESEFVDWMRNSGFLANKADITGKAQQGPAQENPQPQGPEQDEVQGAAAAAATPQQDNIQQSEFVDWMSKSGFLVNKADITDKAQQGPAQENPELQSPDHDEV